MPVIDISMIAMILLTCCHDLTICFVNALSSGVRKWIHGPPCLCNFTGEIRCKVLVMVIM